jgi:hypothetical protein
MLNWNLGWIAGVSATMLVEAARDAEPLSVPLMYLIATAAVHAGILIGRLTRS